MLLLPMPIIAPTPVLPMLVAALPQQLRPIMAGLIAPANRFCCCALPMAPVMLGAAPMVIHQILKIRLLPIPLRSCRVPLLLLQLVPAGVQATASTNVVVNALPVASITPFNPILCPGQNQNVNLTASGGVSYKWSTGGTNNNITVTPVVTTTYYVTVTDANGCTCCRVNRCNRFSAVFNQHRHYRYQMQWRVIMVG